MAVTSETHKGRHEGSPLFPQENGNSPHPGITPHPFSSLLLARGLETGRRKN